jgi:hypothetical protein
MTVETSADVVVAAIVEVPEYDTVGVKASPTAKIAEQVAEPNKKTTNNHSLYLSRSFSSLYVTS